MNDGSWRDESLKKLKEILETDKKVLSLSVYGSLANTQVEKDRWSDIDALLIVEDTALNDYFPNTNWLTPLGDIFIIQQSSTEVAHVTKVIFSDFRKIDLVITTRSKAVNERPIWTRQVVIFTNSDEVKKVLEEKALTLIPFDSEHYDLDKLVNEYWYISFTVVTKVIRNDLLISLHLALELYRLCLVLGMWLRDRETSTSVHRTGGIRNDIIEKMNIQLDQMTSEGILSLVEQCGKEFDRLALEWSPEYAPHHSKFQKLLFEARKDLST